MPYLRILSLIYNDIHIQWYDLLIVSNRFRHWLTEVYAVFATGYLTYDVWAMYQVYKCQVARTSLNTASLTSFINSDKAMMFHHFGLPCLFLPMILVNLCNYW